MSFIITNPPYSQLDKFIVKAKEVAIDKFAFLCKLTHLGGVERFNSEIFKDEYYPLTKIYLFTRQANIRFFNKNEEIKNLDILKLGKEKYAKKYDFFKKQIDYPYLREDGKYPAGMYYYVWLLWENMNMGFDIIKSDPPTFHWINNQKYILSSKD